MRMGRIMHTEVVGRPLGTVRFADIPAASSAVILYKFASVGRAGAGRADDIAEPEGLAA